MVHLYKPPCCGVVSVWYPIITTACVHCVFDWLARKDWLARITYIHMYMCVYITGTYVHNRTHPHYSMHM